MVVVSELAVLFNLRSSSTESLENGFDVSTWLHGNDSQLILLVDPDEESLSIVMENTSARWPVSIEAT